MDLNNLIAECAFQQFKMIVIGNTFTAKKGSIISTYDRNGKKINVR